MLRSFITPNVFFVFAVILSSFSLSGCGGSLADVAGTVKKDGKPLPDADLVFAPTGDKQRSFYALSVEGGEFQVDYGDTDGMPPGTYKITVTWYTLPNGQPLPAGEAGTDLKSSGKAREHSKQLTRDISSGKNTLELDVVKD